MDLKKLIGSRYDITDVYVGDTLYIEFKLVTTDASEEAPIDLTGYRIVSKVKRQYQDGNAILVFDTADNSILTSPLEGEFTLIKTANDMKPHRIAAGKYVYDIVLISESDEVSTLLSGNFEIKNKASLI
jgi:hypothetical protein